MPRASGRWLVRVEALVLVALGAGCEPPVIDSNSEQPKVVAGALAVVASQASNSGTGSGAEQAVPVASAAPSSVASAARTHDGDTHVEHQGAVAAGEVAERAATAESTTLTASADVIALDSGVDLSVLLAQTQRTRVRRPIKRKPPPLGILEGSYARIRSFDAEFSPRPWQISKWDPGGFIDYVNGERVFRTVSADRQVVPQRRGHRDLGCLSGMIEAVRATVHPEIALLEVEPCHAGPNSPTCTPERTGVRVLEQLAVHLQPKAKLQPLRVQPIANETPLVVVPELPWIGLCSLGHDARKREGLHYEHHMVIASRVHDDEIIFFDVTGINGPNLRRIYEDRLRYYLAEWLARSKTFDYDPATATLTCLAVLPPDETI